MKISALDIKKALYEDFGYQLDISGGSGQSIEDPITIKAKSEDQANATELKVIRGIGMGRNLYWRSLQTNTHTGIHSSIIQRKIETKEFTSEDIITQTESYYFERPNVLVSSDTLNTEHIVHHDLNAQINFPFELGWLHFTELIDYENRQAGLGYSLAYGAPGIKATVYVYPIGERDTSPENELKSALGDIIKANGEGAIHHHWGIKSNKRQSSFYFITGEKSAEFSVLSVISNHKQFIKYRITFIDYPELRAFSQNFEAEVLKIVEASYEATSKKTNNN